MIYASFKGVEFLKKALIGNFILNSVLISLITTIARREIPPILKKSELIPTFVLRWFFRILTIVCWVCVYVVCSLPPILETS